MKRRGAPNIKFVRRRPLLQGGVGLGEKAEK